jgi:gluconate 2-dehydrogenase gamma chain
MIKRWSRREMLKRAAVAGAVGTVPVGVLAQARAAEPYANLTAAEGATLEAIVARLIPSDASGPGALEAGASRYIDRALGDALARWREAYATGLAAIEAYARGSAGKPFTELSAERQDSVLRDLEQNAATGFTPSSATFFELVLGHTLEGTFGDPHYGGNRDFIGWELIGYPGLRLAVTAEQQRMDAKLEPLHSSAYDHAQFDEHSTAGERDGD